MNSYVRRALRLAPLVLAGLFLLIQLVPYGRSHDNPPVVQEPQWATPETRELAVRACYDCHSNEVNWPWYSNVAPISWITTNHVNEGREELNFSDFGRGESDDIIESIIEGSMPPAYYTVAGLHSSAKLSEEEKATLIAGLRATPGIDEEGDHDDDD